jgi:D-arabinose 1-dehydrogenase-like Zn-dependent alcohol dehydrogenase
MYEEVASMLYPGVTVFISLIRNGASPSEKVGETGTGTLVSIFLFFVPLLSVPFPV